LVEPRCSAISSTQDEGLCGTASIVRSWLLVEQPGPWGSEAVAESDLPLEVAGPLAEQARRHGFRALLLRRPDRPDRASAAGRHCYVAHSSRRRTWIEHRLVPDPAELLGVDFARLQAGEPVGFGAPHDGPLYLVCTNGRHDPCCAQFGRPVARALARDRDSVWECSHVGGDRFAGNLVCLPHGLYFGRLGPSEATSVVDDYERGRIAVEFYRGRAGDPFVVQAADCLLRAETGMRRLDDVEPVWRRPAEDGAIDVGFDARDGRRFEVRVAVRPAAEGRSLTCAARHVEHPPVYSLVSVQAT
jgi:hypothetical protein